MLLKNSFPHAGTICLLRGLIETAESAESKRTTFCTVCLGITLSTKHRRNGVVSISRIFKQEHTFFPMLQNIGEKQNIPDLFVEGHNGLRNTTS
jgi:hypothetical protein